MITTPVRASGARYQERDVCTPGLRILFPAGHGTDRFPRDHRKDGQRLLRRFLMAKDREKLRRQSSG